MLKLKDSELSTALRIVQEAAQAEGHKPDSIEDLNSLLLLAIRYAYSLQERAASIRAAVETLNSWQRECKEQAMTVTM